MKYSFLNRFAPLRQQFEPQAPDGGGGAASATLNPEDDDGLSLSDRFAKSGFAASADPNPPPAKAVETPPVKTTEPPPAKTTETPPPGDDDEEFPEIGKIATASAGGADEPDEFDTEAEKREKAMEFKDEKSGDHWKWLKQQAKESRKRAQELEQRLTTAQVPPEVETKVKALEAEIEGLRARNLELTQVSDQTAIRQTEEYVQSVTKPLESIGEVLAQIAEAKGVDIKVLEDAMLEPNPAIQDEMLDSLTSKLGPRLANRLASLADDTKRIFSTRDRMLADAGKQLEQSKLQQAERAKQDAQRRASVFQTAVKSSFEAYAARVPGYTDSNGHLTDVGKAATAAAAALDINSLAPEDLGYMAFCLKALPELRRHIRKMDQELSILRAGKTSSAGMGGGAPPDAGGGAAPDNEFDDGASLADRMKGKQFTFTPPS